MADPTASARNDRLMENGGGEEVKVTASASLLASCPSLEVSGWGAWWIDNGGGAWTSGHGKYGLSTGVAVRPPVTCAVGLLSR